MKMKWQFSTILTAICAVCAISSVGAKEIVMEALTAEDVARMRGQLQEKNGQEKLDHMKEGALQPKNAKEQLDRLGSGPLDLLKPTGVQQPDEVVRKKHKKRNAKVRVKAPSSTTPPPPTTHRRSKPLPEQPPQQQNTDTIPKGDS